MTSPAQAQAEISERLAEQSRLVRRTVLETAHRVKSGHVGSSMSAVDLLVALYFHHLRIDPQNPRDPARDRFILSKGHGCLALYATLAHRGFLPLEELATFTKDDSRLPGHPSSLLLPGIDASTGSLGHGLGIGVGMALAAQRNKATYRTVVVVSDGECDEGSTWESVLSAAQWRLASLTCMVDYNKIQSFGRTRDVLDLEPFADKWRAFGWHVQEIDGHKHREILAALEHAARETQQPSVIIAHTTKGKGLTYMEDTIESHYWPPSDEDLEKGLADLVFLLP